MPDILSFLVGLVFDPRGTARRAFSQEPPPFQLSCLLMFTVTILVPVILQIYRYDLDALAIPTAIAFVVYVMISLAVFVILEGVLLMLNGVMVPIPTLIALNLYILMQITIGVWILFVYDYARNGAVLLVISIITGAIDGGDKTVMLIPYVFAYFGFAALMLLASALSLICNMKKVSGYLLAVLSLVPLCTSIICGIHIADLFRPGLIDTFQMLFAL